MNKLLHSLPWTLALSLAAQAGEPEKNYGAESGNSGIVRESDIQTDRVKNKEFYESRFPNISAKDLGAAIKKKSVVLVDANGSESFSEGHIPGALDFEGRGEGLASVLPADKNALIVAYCGGPGCRAWNRAADRLDELGYTNVRHYKGGLKEWKDSGRKLSKG